MIDVKIIKTENEYKAALARVDELLDAAPGSPEEDELELISFIKIPPGNQTKKRRFH